MPRSGAYRESARPVPVLVSTLLTEPVSGPLKGRRISKVPTSISRFRSALLRAATRTLALARPVHRVAKATGERSVVHASIRVRSAPGVRPIAFPLGV